MTYNSYSFQNVSYLFDANHAQIEYVGFLLGYTQHARYIHANDFAKSETGVFEYKAAWRRPMTPKWQIGHIYVNRKDKTLALAKECIDFQLVLEHEEFIRGRPLKPEELRPFYESLTALTDHAEPLDVAMSERVPW